MELSWYLLSRWLIKIKWKIHYKHLTLLNGLLTHLVYANVLSHIKKPVLRKDKNENIIMEQM